MYSDRVDSVTRATNPSPLLLAPLPSPFTSPPSLRRNHRLPPSSSSISSTTFSFATFASFCFSASTCSDASACKARSRGQTSDSPFPSPPLTPFVSLPPSLSLPILQTARTLSLDPRARVSPPHLVVYVAVPRLCVRIPVRACVRARIYKYMYAHIGSREVARLSGPLTYYREPPLACL